ncbi:MAG: hypothetical protein WC565_02960 [Parcubacteria group bacterium]
MEAAIAMRMGTLAEDLERPPARWLSAHSTAVVLGGIELGRLVEIDAEAAARTIKPFDVFRADRDRFP